MTTGNPYSQNPCQFLDFYGCHFSVLLWRIITPIFILIGLSGNILSVAVFSRKRMRNTPTSVYLRFLAVVDSLVILTALLRDMVLYYTYIDVRKLSDFSCRFHIYISSTARLVAIWLLCVIAIDRLILVKHPIWAKSKCTKKQSFLTAMALTIFLFILNSHMFIFFKRSEIMRFSKETNTTVLVGYTCSFISNDYRQFHMMARSIIIMILFSIVPIICLIISSVILLRAIAVRHKKKQERTAAVNNMEQRGSTSVMKMLIAICVFFVTMYVPAIVYQMVSPYIFDKTSRADTAKQMAFTSVLSCLYYSNNCFNFLLYCVSGKLFRIELRGIHHEVKIAILKRMNGEVAPFEQRDESYGDASGTGRPTTSGNTAAKTNETICDTEHVQVQKRETNA